MSTIPMNLAIDEVFTSSEQELITQGLYQLLEVKQKALEGIEVARLNNNPLVRGSQQFTAQAFGIPQILALIEKMNAE